MEPLKMIQQTIVYLEDNLLKQVELEELAQHIGESPFHLNQTFTMITGMNIEEYMRNRRLTEAAAELVDGRSSLLEIARQYQYPDAPAFSDDFRDYHGLSPLQARSHQNQLKQLNRLFVKFSVTEEPPIPYLIQSRDFARMTGYREQIRTKELYNHFLLADLLYSYQEDGKIQNLTSNHRVPLYVVIHPHAYGLEVFIGIESNASTDLETEHLHHQTFAVFKERGHLDYVFNEIWQSIEQQVAVMLNYRKNDYYIIQLNEPLDFDNPYNKVLFHLPID
ncbi:AraC family transcriptional regulator [Macrococcus brunensis]|uniref:AraC family transcriptional regulator n=1 Tax=Macrococcus brunensis TaxID=198483 RepID=A0A4R6BDU4_9STAP|nr:helix-turn-helix domain-containing protein [Macrococcus brunensis]TDL97853.1 AraC family transcriptional regulator [Macrococcus brunensis]ULG71061.1 AraC family transcriptional regulator [Macrococcus brunensis]ULG73397.1 AraC family transcriptional regulator [Macrococcus brunensis]